MKFSELIATQTLGDNSASINVPADWLQGRSMYGGLQTALAVNAMRTQVEGNLPLRSLQVTFIAPIDPGAVTASATLLRSGRSASHVSATITGPQGTAFHAIGIFGAARPSAIDFKPEMATACPPPEDFEDLPYIEGKIPAFLQHYHMRHIEGPYPYSGADNGGSRIYMKHRDDDVMSEGHLFTLADATAPAVLPMLKGPARVSSMNWAMELLKTPEEIAEQRWFRFDTQLQATNSGYTWQSAGIYSLDNELFALSRQCVAIFELNGG